MATIEKALQIAAKVDRRIALALPFFSMEILAIVIPTFSASSVGLTSTRWIVQLPSQDSSPRTRGARRS